MKKLLVLALLCSCGPSIEERVKAKQKEQQKQFDKNEKCIDECWYCYGAGAFGLCAKWR